MTKETNPLVTSEHISKLKSVLAKHRGKEVAILVAQTDGDAIACAMGFSPCLSKLEVIPRIFYAGGFGHPQKGVQDDFELMKVFMPISELPEDMPCILVDSSRLDDNRFRIPIASERFIGIIDHHIDKIEDHDGIFVIQKSCGAAATLVKIIADELGVELTEKLRTILAVGIMTDTDRLMSPSVKREDRKAVSELRDAGVNETLLRDSLTLHLPEHYKHLFAETIKTEEIIHGVRIAHLLDRIKPDDGDLLSIIADKLLEIGDASIVVVWGIPGDFVRASIRTRRSAGMSDFMDAVFGEGNGGGKHGSWGARIDLDGMLTPRDDAIQEQIACISAVLKARIKEHKGRPGKEH